MQNEFKINVFKPPALSYITARIPDSLLNQLLIDSGKLERNKNKTSYEKHLVGNFKNGEQLAIKPGWGEMISGFESFKQLETIKCQMAETYIAMYFEDPSTKFKPQEKEVVLGDMWLNIQKEGDFNPVHNHNCKTVTGISSFCWLAFPEQVMQTSRLSSPGEAEHRGMTYLHWGLTPASYSKQFMYPKNTGLLPTPGVIVMFPSWLEHVVYPFKGPGKRISIASNIDIELR